MRSSKFEDSKVKDTFPILQTSLYLGGGHNHDHGHDHEGPEHHDGHKHDRDDDRNDDRNGDRDVDLDREEVIFEDIKVDRSCEEYEDFGEPC